MAWEKTAKLDPRENHFHIPGPVEGLRLFLRQLAPDERPGAFANVVLFVHGMSFSSALSIAHRFDGWSWRDHLRHCGFDVWGLDFYGFGNSDRYAEMSQPDHLNPPLGQVEDLDRQVEHAVRFICDHHRREKISLIAHSAGAIATGRFAARCPELVDRLVFFAPICRREAKAEPPPRLPAWRLVSLQQQWDRFVADVPPSEQPVLSAEHFREWGEAYLGTDAESRTRSPASVKTPTGMLHEIHSAWNGHLGYEPERVHAPVLIVRGEWDTLCSDADASGLFHALIRSPIKRDVKIGRATHLMHLEESRYALYRESQIFLEGENKVNLTMDQKPTDQKRDTESIAGYDYGRSESAHSPLTMDELRQLEATVGWSQDDAATLQRHGEIFRRNAEQMVDSWRAVIAKQPHLAKWFFGPDGAPDDEYKARVKARFVQWVLDACFRAHDQAWLDYQEEIGLRHTPEKKNLTDGAKTPSVVPLRYLIAFGTVVVTGARRFFEDAGVRDEDLRKLEDAWARAVQLHIALWSRPYTKEGLW